MTRLVRLIGSKWDGSRVDAPKCEIPEHGVKLKLKGYNFRVIEKNGELVAYFMGELSDDAVIGADVRTSYGQTRMRRRFDVCEQCNYDRHQCGGCGAELSHDGINLSGPKRGYPHELDRCYE